jgi:hypothetical protein
LKPEKNKVSRRMEPREVTIAKAEAAVSMGFGVPLCGI